VGFGGSPVSRADITFAGWVPDSFFGAVGLPGSNGVALPFVFDAVDESLVWGLDVLDPTRELSDINDDGKHDLFATEIYFNSDGNFVVDDDELGNTLFYIDLESIVLHELGHALGMDHFGRTKIILDEDGNFVDIILNRNSVPMMNTDNFFINRDVTGSDKASFCGIYGSWGKGRAST
jgi:DNA-binding beta-propeller fold protein YncE